MDKRCFPDKIPYEGSGQAPAPKPQAKVADDLPF